MSGNVHLNPGLIYPCSVCAVKVTWRSKSVQCCTCCKWVHLRCLQFFLSKFKILGSSHSSSCPPCCASTRNTVVPFSDSSDMHTSTIQSSPLLLMLHFYPPSLQTSYLRSAHFVSSPSAPSPQSLAPGCPSTSPASSPSLKHLGFFNGMLAVFEPEALNYFTLFRPIPLTLSVPGIQF